MVDVIFVGFVNLYVLVEDWLVLKCVLIEIGDVMFVEKVVCLVEGVILVVFMFMLDWVFFVEMLSEILEWLEGEGGEMVEWVLVVICCGLFILFVVMLEILCWVWGFLFVCEVVVLEYCFIWCLYEFGDFVEGICV